MPTPLSIFLEQQISLLGLTPDKFAKRARMTRSHVYFILNGDRVNVRSDTLDKIAAAVGMTPAEMAMAMGKGDGTLSPSEAQWLAIIRQVPTEHHSAGQAMLLGLTAVNDSNTTGVNTHGHKLTATRTPTTAVRISVRRPLALLVAMLSSAATAIFGQASPALSAATV